MRAACLALGWLLSWGGPARANPADTYGFGSRAVALGGAVAADTNDFSANYYNPAGLVLAERTRLSFGLQAVEPQLRLDGRESPVQGFRAAVLGLVVPGRFAGLPIAIGVGAQLTGDRLSRVVTFAEEDLRWVFHEDRPEQIFVAANAALRPVSWLAIGFGFAFLASTDGELTIRGSATQPGFSGQDEYDSRLSHEVVAELASERYPHLGVWLQPLPDLGIAVVYRGQGSVVLDVDARFDGDIALGPLPLPAYYRLESTTVQSFVPRQWVLGLSYSGVSHWHCNLDLGWTEWSGYQSPRSATRSELAVDARGLLLALPELPEPTYITSARLEDRLTPRLGVEYRLPLQRELSLPLRLGYVFEATPLAPGSSPNFLDADRHVLSGGVGVSGPGPAPLTGELALDGHVAWSHFAPRRSVGPDAETHRADGNVLVVGATLGLSL